MYVFLNSWLKNDIAQLLCLMQNDEKDASSLVYSISECPEY